MDFNRSKKKKLLYPGVNDPIWKNTNEELEDAVPQILNNHILNNFSSQKLIEQLDNGTYEFLKAKLHGFEQLSPTSIRIRTFF